MNGEGTITISLQYFTELKTAYDALLASESCYISWGTFGGSEWKRLSDKKLVEDLQNEITILRNHITELQGKRIAERGKCTCIICKYPRIFKPHKEYPQ